MKSDFNFLEKGSLERWIKNNKDKILNHLLSLIKKNTWSNNKDNINQALDFIQSEILKSEKKYIIIKRFKCKEAGDLMLIQPAKPNKSDTNILLSSHIDTVYQSNDQRVKIENGKLFGPGACDMKGGLIVALYSLLFFAHLKNKNINVSILISPDEEIGSTFYSQERKKIFSSSNFALVYESCGDRDEVVIKRKGIRQYRLIAFGDGGHSGYFVGKNKNAILTLCECLLKLYKLNNSKLERSINIGVIKGGSQPNVIPERAEATAEFRAFSDKDLDKLQFKLKKIASSVKIKYENILNLSPLETNKKELKLILSLLDDIYKKEGLKLITQTRSGGSDANHIFKFVPAVIDGFGPKGGASHSQREWMDISSLFKRLSISIQLLFSLNSLYAK